MAQNIDREAIAIGRAARGAIATAGLSLAEAAAATGITLSTMSRRVNGTLPFTFPELVRLAGACGVRVSDIAASAERILDKAAA